MKKTQYIEPKINVTVRVPVDVYITMKQMASDNQWTLNDVINEAIQGYFTAAGITPYSYKEFLRAQIKEELRQEVKKEMELTLF